MGQYFACVNIDTGEFIDPFAYVYSESTIMGHSWIDNSFMKAAETLLRPGGSWHKTRIVWAGEYMKKGLFLNDVSEKVIKSIRLQLLFNTKKVDLEYVRKTWTLRSFAYEFFNELKEENMQEKKKYVYLLNHSKAEYVDMTKLPKTHRWTRGKSGLKEYACIHPLSILTSSGNKNSDGDYEGKAGKKYIGSWAGDVISVEKEVPENFTEIQPKFKED